MTASFSIPSLFVLCFLSGTSFGKFNEEEFSRRANTFAINLYKTVSANSPSNVIISPLSLELLLAELYLGAGGETEKDLQEVLFLPSERQNVLDSHKSTLQKLRTHELSMVSKIFADRSFQIKKAFQDDLKAYFSSPVENVDFKRDSEGLRKTINAWVEQQTYGKVQQLLPQGSINSATSLLLTNAIHFKAKWLRKFPKVNTHPDKFYVALDKTEDVQMMHTSEVFRFRRDSELAASILELPYQDRNFRMLLILPHEKNGLAAVESKLRLSNLFLNDYSATNVDVYLPKFKLAEDLLLNDILSQMGLNSIFTRANLTGISEQNNLGVSAVIQKAIIELDEEGTEASAASAGDVQFLSARRTPVFYANRPFIFSILYRNFVLFIGSVKKNL